MCCCRTASATLSTTDREASAFYHRAPPAHEVSPFRRHEAIRKPVSWLFSYLQRIDDGDTRLVNPLQLITNGDSPVMTVDRRRANGGTRVTTLHRSCDS